MHPDPVFPDDGTTVATWNATRQRPTAARIRARIVRQQEPEPPPRAVSRALVLLVDPNPYEVLLLTTAASKIGLGAEFICVTSVSALAKLVQQPMRRNELPRLIMLGAHFKDGTCDDAVALLRQDVDWRLLPAVLYVHAPEDPAAGRWQQWGLEDCWVKPSSSREWLDIVALLKARLSDP
jgi:CheY-like chemotaxis protein